MPCTDDVCTAGACTHPPKLNGAACADDGNPCTSDQCMGGACTHANEIDGYPCADDGNLCTDDVCKSGGCTHPANTTLNYCTLAGGGTGVCRNATCQTVQYACQDAIYFRDLTKTGLMDVQECICSGNNLFWQQASMSMSLPCTTCVASTSNQNSTTAASAACF
jgi:hypothetical protein